MWAFGFGILAVALALSLVRLGMIPPPSARLLIQIRNHALDVRRGALRAYARDSLAEILREGAVSRGFIAVTAANKVYFSRSIAPAFHQRIRNVILNQ
jgi:hypothetical protein